MADKTIGTLPAAESLDDESLLVAEQQGEAVSVSGALFKQFAVAAAQFAVDAAKAAADRAEAAVAHSPTVGESGTWLVWDANTGTYVDSGVAATGANGSSIQSIERTEGSGASGTTDTYTVTLTDGSKTAFQVYNGKDGTVTFADLTAEQKATLKGDKGDPGEPGKKGDTPVKGTDYWTEADKTEIVNGVLAALPVAEEESF